ncbi:hypothetical protein Zmor_011337 [Zophobas morio]|uniref:Uncharacterized protein n=2 Tax=Zophobas morio TaxID=2755281 RepID=A0AA38MJE4_9CUCU|nr:hypothetical protein Zmor_011337 [Zophobas morio]
MRETSEAAILTIDPEQENFDNKTNTKGTSFFKIVRKLASACNERKINFKQIKALKEKHEFLRELEILKTLDDDSSQTRYVSPESKISFKEDLLTEVLDMFCQKCGDDKIDLWFFASATCNVKILEETAKDYDGTLLCKPRCCDSALVFLLKYGNIHNEGFLECVNILLTAGISVNEPDFNGRTAVDIVCSLYENEKNKDILEKLKKLVFKFLEQNVCHHLLEKKTKIILQNLQEENKNLPSQTQEQHKSEEANKLQLFAWIGKERTQEFLGFREIRNFINCDNGEYTLLQFACKKSERMHPVVKFLIDNGVNINNVTEIYKITPLELAAKNNHEKSFQIILKNKNLNITQEIFNNFVRWRSSPMKLKIFEMFLESDKLDPCFTYETTGNTPLHYATRFCHKDAMRKLLKRSPQTLFVENKNGKTVLDIIDIQEVEKYFDSCLVSDRYATDFSSTDYKMLFRFKSLVTINNNGEYDEESVVAKVVERNHLEQLLTHPLLHTFIILKWSRTVWYYWMILLLQGFLFIALSVCIYRLSDCSPAEFKWLIFLTFINLFLKLAVVLKPRFWALDNLRMPTLYECGEVLLMLTLFVSFFSAEWRAFAFIEMSLLFLLTVGYHPKIAKWTVMLKRVFKSFTVLMVFFSIIIIAFAAAFHTLFKNTNHDFFDSIGKSIFLIYVMISGEFNIENVKFGRAHIGGYILFFIFAIFVALVIVNFWTGVAVTDIETIQKDAEINAFKNVITFMMFVQRNIYVNKSIRKFLPYPFLFTETEHRNYQVDFYINKKNQFEGRDNFPASIGQNSLEKIKNFNSKHQNELDGANILLKLEEISKILNELKNTAHRNGNYSINVKNSTAQNDKNRNRQKEKVVDGVHGNGKQ